MRYFILSLLFVGLFVSTSTSWAQTEGHYKKITQEKFQEIKDAMYQQVDFSPILLTDFEREDRIAFYVQSMGDETIKVYVDWAADKVLRLLPSKVSDKQRKEFTRIRALPQNSQTVYEFLWVCTDEMIETIGY